MGRRIQIALLVLSNWFGILLAQVNTDSLRFNYIQKAEKYLDKGKQGDAIFLINFDGVELYKPAKDSLPKQLVNFFSWEQIDSLVKINQARITVRGAPEFADRPQLLRNVRIALDPGHLAGDLLTAKMERKWVEMKNPAVQLIEGELTLATALLLKEKLELQGAIVFLTRDKPNQSSFGIDFNKWKDSLFLKTLKTDFESGKISLAEKMFYLNKANDTEIFRKFFLKEDSYERARKINEFNPDITLIIHYNVDETNTSWDKPTKKNYNMAFVGGAFMKDEFTLEEDRTDFLRLLLTDDLEKSIDFSKYILRSLVSKTNVLAALDSNAVYLNSSCMNTEVEGVYCRNLTLTRKVKGVICYGESLYQDNINECLSLSKKEIKIGSFLTSKRVQEVADAYYEGIINYIKNRKP